MNVLELLRQRKTQLERTGSWDDSHKLGLSVEGGGMRGIVTAAMLIALRDQGYLDVFDAYYGSSSGGSNLAYVLAGQAWQGLNIYYDKLATRAFIAPQRALKRKSVLDMKYVERVLKTDVPLDTKALLAKPSKLVLTISNVTTNRGELWSSFRSESELIAVLLASLQIPLLGGRPLLIDENLYLDGGLFYADPFYAAIDDDCTHVLALHSRPRNGYPAKLRSGFPITTRLLNNLSPGSGDLYQQTLADYYADSAQIGFGALVYNKTELYRHAVANNAHHVTRMTADISKLLAAARVSYRSVIELLGDRSQVYFSLTTSHN